MVGVIVHRIYTMFTDLSIGSLLCHQKHSLRPGLNGERLIQGYLCTSKLIPISIYLVLIMHIGLRAWTMTQRMRFNGRDSLTRVGAHGLWAKSGRDGLPSRRRSTRRAPLIEVRIVFFFPRPSDIHSEVVWRLMVKFPPLHKKSTVVDNM